MASCTYGHAVGDGNAKSGMFMKAVRKCFMDHDRKRAQAGKLSKGTDAGLCVKGV